MDKQFIQERISELRYKNDLSEYELSYMLGKSKGYIQSISSGRSLPSMEMFLELCDIFNISPADFFNDTPNSSELLTEIQKNLNKLSADDLYLVYKFILRLMDDGK